MTSSRSACASTTASALCPMEPVDPRMAMRFTVTSEGARNRERAQRWSARALQALRSSVLQHHVVDRGGEEERVDAVEDAAVARNQRRAVLHAGRALQHRLEEIAGD